jgi:hypothetical protein
VGLSVGRVRFLFVFAKPLDPNASGPATPAPAPATARRNDAAKAEWLAGLSVMREGALRAAKALRAIDHDAHFVFEGHGSLEEFGERNGATSWETRQLAWFGLALEADPGLEAKYLAGLISLPSGALLGKVLTGPGMVKPGEDWIGWAESESSRTFRRRVGRRIEEVRAGDEPVVMLTIYLTAKARLAFDRARVIASRKAQRSLTEGETLEQVVEHYLSTFDPQSKAEAVRRMPHTSMAPGRTVPAKVAREVARRTDDHCAVPFCDHAVFLQNAHIVPHAHGGDREASNLVRLCSRHHRMFDAGQLRMEGTPDHPTFFGADGEPLGERRQAAPGTSSPGSGRGRPPDSS